MQPCIRCFYPRYPRWNKQQLILPGVPGVNPSFEVTKPARTASTIEYPRSLLFSPRKRQRGTSSRWLQCRGVLITSFGAWYALRTS